MKDLKLNIIAIDVKKKSFLNIIISERTQLYMNASFYGKRRSSEKQIQLRKLLMHYCKKRVTFSVKNVPYIFFLAIDTCAHIYSNCERFIIQSWAG